MEIIMSIQVSIISRINFDYEENGGEKKPFLQIERTNILCPNVENMIIVLLRKRMGIITSIQACIFSWINFNYMENGGKRSFCCQT